VTVGSLFAGIGGFDLGFRRAGFLVQWQVEIDPFCRAVLAKHWPNVRRFEDVRECCGNPQRCWTHDGRCADCGRRDFLPHVDVICGGFPCQDISSAGGKVGIDGQQSGLWREMFRVVCELRPRYVVVENVADLLARGFGRVLGDLASVGYDAEWDCIQAAAIGAPHGRDRLWLVAYPNAESHGIQSERVSSEGRTPLADVDRMVPNLSDADGETETERARRWARTRLDFARWRIDARQRAGWETEPDLCRMADGISPGLDNARLVALGNSIVPQIAEWLARRILDAENS
jgi:DNA (cytosine-5)-methyltransferase 1